MPICTGLYESLSVWEGQQFWVLRWGSCIHKEPKPLVGPLKSRTRSFTSAPSTPLCHLPDATLRQGSLYDTNPNNVLLFFFGNPSKPQICIKFDSPPKWVVPLNLTPVSWGLEKPSTRTSLTSDVPGIKQTKTISQLLVLVLTTRGPWPVKSWWGNKKGSWRV